MDLKAGNKTIHYNLILWNNIQRIAWLHSQGELIDSNSPITLQGHSGWKSLAIATERKSQRSKTHRHWPNACKGKPGKWWQEFGHYLRVESSKSCQILYKRNTNQSGYLLPEFSSIYFLESQYAYLPKLPGSTPEEENLIQLQTSHPAAESPALGSIGPKID